MDISRFQMNKTHNNPFVLVVGFAGIPNIYRRTGTHPKAWFLSFQNRNGGIGSLIPKSLEKKNLYSNFPRLVGNHGHHKNSRRTGYQKKKQKGISQKSRQAMDQKPAAESAQENRNTVHHIEIGGATDAFFGTDGFENKIRDQEIETSPKSTGDKLHEKKINEFMRKHPQHRNERYPPPGYFERPQVSVRVPNLSPKTLKQKPRERRRCHDDHVGGVAEFDVAKQEYRQKRRRNIHRKAHERHKQNKFGEITRPNLLYEIKKTEINIMGGMPKGFPHARQTNPREQPA